MINIIGNIISGSIIGGGSIEIPSPLQAFVVSSTEINLESNVVSDASTYEFQRATEPTFASPTALQNTSSRTYSDTGLTANTTYYYRVRAVGSANSDWVTVSRKTLSFAPAFWGELNAASINATGAEDSVTSDNYTTQNGSNELATIKPVFGSTDSYTLNGVNANTIASNTPYASFRFLILASSGYLTLSSAKAFTGDFTIAVKATLRSTFNATNKYVFDGSDCLAFISDPGTGDRFRATIGGVTTNLPFVNSLPPATVDADYGTTVEMVIKRVGTTVSFSWDGGTNYDSATYGSGTMTVDTLFATSAGGNPGIFRNLDRVLFYDGELTTSQLSEFFDYGVITDDVPNSLPVGSTINIKGTTYSALPTDGLFSDTIHLQAIGNWVRDGRIFELKDKHIIVTSKAVISPTFGEDSIRVVNQSNANQTSALIDTGTYHKSGDLTSVKQDVHNLSSTFIYNNCLYVIEVYPHYGFINVKRSGYNFDFSQFTTIKVFNGLLDKFGDSLQYLHIKVLNDNEIYIIGQRDNSGSNEIVCLKTTTDFNSIESWLLCKVGSNSDIWVYPHIVNDGKTTEAVILLNIIDKTVNPSPAVPAGIFTETCLIRTSDFETLDSMDGVTSNEVRASQTELTLSDLTTNYSLSSDLTEDVTCTNLHFDGTEYFGIEGDGAGGWNAIFINDSTGTKTTQSIDLGAITVIDSRNEDGGYIYKTSTNNYEVYLMATVATKNVPYKFSTTDKGATWSQDGVVTGIDATKNYNRIYGTENQHEATKVFLETAQIDTGNDAFLQLIDIT